MGNETKISISSCVNNDEILKNNLLRSQIYNKSQCEFEFFRGMNSASEAYNLAIQTAKSEYIVFVHQDVYLPNSWHDKLVSAINHLNASDPNWAIIGAYGIQQNGTHCGYVWSSGLGKAIGEPVSTPVLVDSIDEIVIILRRSSGVRFDPELPGFHLYATDLVQTAKSLGKNAYVANIPVIHNSRPVSRLGKAYSEAYKYLRRKWWNSLPLKSVVTPVTKTGFALLRTRIKLYRTQRERIRRATDHMLDPRKIAKQLGLE